MNKADLIAKLAEKHGLSKAEAGRIVESLLGLIVDAVAAGEAVKISGFAAFEQRAKEARTARNPRTGEEIAVPAKKVVRIRPLKNFSDAVKS